MYTGYVYRHWIINDKNEEKSYIGKAIGNFNSRWGKNGKGYEPYDGNSTKFWNAIKRYGWNNFQHDILLKIECESKQELNFWLKQWEMYYIELFDSYKNGYNSTKGGDGSLGCYPTNKTRKKISNSLKGEKNPMYGKRGELSPCYGRTGEKHPMYGKRGELSPNFGKKHKKELKERYSKERTGKNNPFSRSVICINTGQVFETMKEAKEWCNVNAGLTSACNGKRKTCGKHPETKEPLRWMYYDEYILLNK